MQTGWESMRIGTIIYFIPFFFVLNPAFVLQGSAWESLLVVTTAAVGVVILCGGLQGYLLGVGDLQRAGRAQVPLRALFICGGLTLAAPGGGIMPLSHGEMLVAAGALLLPALATAKWLLARANRNARPMPGVIAAKAVEPGIVPPGRGQ